MSDEHFAEDDPLAGGLGQLPAAAFDAPRAPDEVRAAIRRRTSALVRTRPRRMRVAAACAVIVAYVAGAATVLLVPGAPSEAPARSVQLPEKEAVSATAGLRDPAKVRARVFDASRGEQIRLLTLAGDMYLSERHDIEQALDCYRQVLELMPLSQPMAVGPDDSWLFASLKLARKQETDHERTQT